ncbi:MAG: caspase family protein [Bacteroidia bacterium]|nr:caspase family protein [Bacteroidia bacterium]
MNKRYCISMRTSCLTLLLMAFQGAWAQSAWTPSDFYGVPDRDRHVVFMDGFDDNRHKWDLGSLYVKETIAEGDFFLASLTSYPYTKYRQGNFNASGNYEIQLQIRITKGSDDAAAGLVFGRDANGSEYRFLFNSKGNFRIEKFDRGRVQEIKPWSPGRNLNRRWYNTLTVRRVAEDWYFFINQTLVAKTDVRPLFGQDLGMRIDGYMACEADYLSVSELLTADRNGPAISLVEPSLSAGRDLLFNVRYQVIRGRVSDPSGVSMLSINGEPITISPSGDFSASLSLPSGKTAIRVEARDRFDNRSEEAFSMTYTEVMADLPKPQPPPPSKPVQVQPPAPPAAPAGTNYVLLIGINTYQNWNGLHNAVKDCQDLAQTLIDLYQFDREHIITLFNEQATRENILETLESLQDRLDEQDNLLIYYAGHGYYDESSGLGYWVPVDARVNKVPDFILNSTIHDYLRTINSRHTFLIADACYAGSLFGTYRGVIDESSRSRWALTSGDIEKVWDGQPGQNSPFARYLIRCLRGNTKPRLPANELIDNVKTLMIQNTAQTPQGSPLKMAGDDGGVFVFERR